MNPYPIIVVLSLCAPLPCTTWAQQNFKIDVWADNWFAAYIDGKLLLKDSVPITTERSFNAETSEFSASYPFELAFLVKDFKQNDTGLEYIGTRRQQMGDGGFIVQVKESSNGQLVGASSRSMKCMVIHKAPLNTLCVKESHPVAGHGPCRFSQTPLPSNWKTASTMNAPWKHAVEYSVSQVRPKGGYNKINWHPSATLIWSDDLETDNSLLCRLRIQKPTGSTAETKHHIHNDHHAYLHEHFGHFGNKTRIEGDYFRIESNGIANHKMMVGITNWQQQVPFPKNYKGSNSWSIPLRPELADEPLSTAHHFHKGAVAIAVNGVPIFSAMNNRGEYSAEIGELDKWGGHSGRADDYHYHLAPEHLHDIVGKDKPIAYALDGFPLYGKTHHKLDKYLGRFNEDGTYEYHATDYRPYYIAGLRGKVKTDSPSLAPEDQIVPQPRSKPVRSEILRPLHGASITNFKPLGDNKYSLEYSYQGQTRYITYSLHPNGTATFIYSDANGRQTSKKTYNYNNDERRPPQRPLNSQLNPHQNSNPNSENSERPPRPELGDRKPRRYCGDGLCDNTENSRRCPRDCQ